MWRSVGAIFLSLQIRGSVLCRLRDEKPISRSLLSGSEASPSRISHSGGGSCFAAPYSKPYVLCSATDAASAVIDFSKGNVEEGIVGSPPSRGAPRTPICSPSPLKRFLSIPSRMRSPSPIQRTEFTPNKKLYTDEIVEAADLRDEDGILLLPIVQNPLQQSGDLNGIILREGWKRKAETGVYTHYSAGRSSRPLPCRSLPSKLMVEKSTSIVVPLNCPKNLGNYQGFDGSPSIGIAIPYINTSSRLLVGHPSRGCRSLSMDGLSRSECKRYREEASQSLKLGTYGSILSGSERSRPS